jgi:cytochrome P450
MSDSLVHDEAIGIFIAGHETTANTMSFLWYALHENPEVAGRLHAELDAVVPGDEPPTLEHLKRLPYTLRTIKEVLRLYPPSPAQPRDPTRDQTLGATPVPVGTYAMLFSYATHRHPAFWEQPERFDPDRFLPEREATRHPFAYFPFGGGPRVCIGNNFALLEVHVLTALLARRFVAHFASDRRPRVDVGGTLKFRDGLPMSMTRRA